MFAKLKKLININTFYLTGALLVIMGLAFVIESPDRFLNPTPETETEEENKTPVAVAHQTSSQHFNEEGALDYVFNAEKLEYYQIPEQTTEEGGYLPARDYTLIDKPSVQLFMDVAPWFIESINGKLSEKGELLNLWQDVKIWQTDKKGNTSSLQTEELTIFPREKLVETDKPVKITTPSGEITATGMIANLNEKRIKLLSNVRGIHDPI